MTQLSKEAFIAKVQSYLPIGVVGGTNATKLIELFEDIKDSFYNNTNDISKLGLKQYDPTFNYAGGMGCFYGLKLLKSKEATTGTFDPLKWDEIFLSPSHSKVLFVDSATGNDGTAVIGSPVFKYATAAAAITAAENGSVIVFGDGIYNIVGNCYKPDIHFVLSSPYTRIDINTCNLVANGNFTISGLGRVKFNVPISTDAAWTGKIKVDCHARTLVEGFLNSQSATHSSCYCKVNVTTLQSTAEYVNLISNGNLEFQDYAGIIEHSTANGGYYKITPDDGEAMSTRNYIIDIAGGDMRPENQGIISLRTVTFPTNIVANINGKLIGADPAETHAVVTALQTSSSQVNVYLNGTLEISGSRVVYTDDGSGTTEINVFDNLDIKHTGSDILYKLPKGLLTIRNNKETTSDASSALIKQNIGKIYFDGCTINHNISDAITTAKLVDISESDKVTFRAAVLRTASASKALNSTTGADLNVKVYASTLIKGSNSHIVNTIAGTNFISE